MFIQGPLLLKRQAPGDGSDADRANIPNYAVVQDEKDEDYLTEFSSETGVVHTT